MNEIDQKLHAAIHQDMMKVLPEKIFSQRVGVFGYVEKKLGLRMSGRILDIGCGSGYASIWLAGNRKVDKIYALEASEAAVTELLPRNIAHYGVADKVMPLLGSFEAIPLRDLDFVVSFGALHHSSCLFSTMKSVGESLSVGGYLIAQEPVMPNTTTHQQYIDKYAVIEERHGLKIRNGDRQDCFFREAEYLVAAAFAGLDLVFYDDYAASLSGSSRFKRWLKKTLRPLFRAPVEPSLSAQHMLEHTKSVLPKIMVFRKPSANYIPHLWRPLAQASTEEKK